MAQLKKYYPIEGRKDFFKHTIIATGESLHNDNARLHKDMKGEAMYFDCEVQAKRVCDAINSVENRRFERLEVLTYKGRIFQGMFK